MMSSRATSDEAPVAVATHPWFWRTIHSSSSKGANRKADRACRPDHQAGSESGCRRKRKASAAAARTATASTGQKPAIQLQSRVRVKPLRAVSAARPRRSPGAAVAPTKPARSGSDQRKNATPAIDNQTSAAGSIINCSTSLAVVSPTTDNQSAARAPIARTSNGTSREAAKGARA